MAHLIRLYVDVPLGGGQQIELSADQAHYINSVMRLKVADQLALFNGQDGEWQGSITEARKKTCLISVENQTRGQDACPDIWLIFAPIKKQRMDFIIEKATELGVSRLQPVITRRTIVSKVRTDRLCSQVVEAAEQCERLHIPAVQDTVALDRLLEEWPQNRRLFVLDEKGGAAPILKALQEVACDTPCAFLVGPEGGFDPSELDLLQKKDFVTPISVGPRILRADTAALAALSCWQSALGDWQEPLRLRKE